MERLQQSGKRSLRSRKRKRPPEKPADEEAREAAVAATAADNGTSGCVETSLPAKFSFVDDGPEEVRVYFRFKLNC